MPARVLRSAVVPAPAGTVLMGIENVKLVYARWRGLPDKAFRAFGWMALRSLDRDRPPVYWAGWEDLATFGLGRHVPAESGDPVAQRERRAALKATATVIKTLLQLDALRVVERSAPGYNAVYALNLHQSVHGQGEPMAPATVHAQGEALGGNGSRRAATAVHAEPTNGSPSTPPTVHAEREPEDVEDVIEELAQDGRSDVRTELAVDPVGPAAGPHPFHADPGSPLRCARCARTRPEHGKPSWSMR